VGYSVEILMKIDLIRFNCELMVFLHKQQAIKA